MKFKYPDSLVKLALLHVEFEALHSFLDGNGRLGRMFIPPFLWQQGIFSHPTFYVSAVFEQDRESYYRRLRAVSEHGAWTEWCQFFLESIHAQAEENIAKAESILALYDEMKRLVPSLLNTQQAMLAVDWIFNMPMFSSPAFIKNSGIPNATARRMLPLLVEGKVLKVIQESQGRRPTAYSFPALLNIVKGREIF